MGAIGTVHQRVVDARAASAAPRADPPVVQIWQALGSLVGHDAPDMGLFAGERPAADVEVLASMAASAEYELARRMVLAAEAGGLPLQGPGAMLRARGWSPGAARRLMAAGQMAVAFPAIADQWAAGVITAEHAAAIDRTRGRLTDDQLSVALLGFEGRWGVLSPRAVGEVIAAIEARLHPPGDPSPDEAAAYESRNLSFALTPEVVLFSGSLPRLEGEAFLAVIDAFAESLRSAADHVPPAARRADGLIAMVEAASTSGAVPMRGGLPVALNVTLTRTEPGDVLAVTSRGHRLTAAELRFTCCDPTLTPVLVRRGEADVAGPSGALASADPGEAGRILAIAEALLGERMPLAVGRTSRVATPAQRRALAVRDRGGVIPGCGVPAETCQVHHLHEWALGGGTDQDNMVLLCWAHHRQVDLQMWRIERSEPDDPPVPTPREGAPPGAPWPSDNGSGWVITRLPRSRWRL
jgi:hypothetical protein